MNNRKGTVLPLERAVCYGPLHSRRLGLSLGINLLSTQRKICSFDCIYCHYGPTHLKTLAPDEHDLPGAETILKAIAQALHRHPEVDSLTFSGNGEPTLHPYFPAILAETARLRDRFAPRAKITVFSNATTLTRPEIHAALLRCDNPILKLDAGDPQTFALIDRPVAGLELATLCAAIKSVPHAITQSAFIGGRVSNVEGDAFEAWLTALAAIRPTQAQIYSTDYPVAEASIEHIPPYRLRALAAEATRRTGVEVTAYWPG